MDKKRWLPFLLLLTLFASCEKGENSRDLRPVRTNVVSSSEAISEKVYTGIAKAESKRKASFRVPGNIDQLPVKVGQKLSNGELIAHLNNEDVLLELEQGKAAREKLEAEERNATSQYKRVKRLYESESVSRNELDSARASYEATKAAVHQSSIQIQLIEKKLSYFSLVSEGSSCTVSHLYAEVNENVRAGQIIAELICGDKIDVEISVPESEIGYFQAGDPVAVVFNVLPEEQFAGVVSEVGYASAVGTTFPVTISVDAMDDRLRSGMAAKVYFDSRGEGDEEPIVVPVDAVSEDSGGHFVYLFESQKGGEGIARKHYIKLGVVSAVGLEVTEGLKPGQRYITAGLRYLSDGKKVKLLQE